MRVLTTVLHAMVDADWPIQMLSCNREFASSGCSFFDPPKSYDQPSSPNFALLGEQNPSESLTTFKQGEEQAKKKARGSLPTVCAAAGFAELAQPR